MKRIILIISVLLLFILSHPISADTIIDSVYAVPELDGQIAYDFYGNFIFWTTRWYNTRVGDRFAMWGPEYFSRAFYSFELPEIQEGFEVQNAVIRLYQLSSQGRQQNVPPDSWYHSFPFWDIGEGYMEGCYVSHINYGNELDQEDFFIGDEGVEGTIQHNIGIISEHTVSDSLPLIGERGYRHLDVTSAVQTDYDSQNNFSQYRIAFETEHDDDGFADCIYLATSESPIQSHRPLLILTFDNTSSIDQEIVPVKYPLILYPNPFKGKCSVSLNSRINQDVEITVFNIKGQKVKKTIKEKLERGENNILIDLTSLSNGIYFFKIKTEGDEYIKKAIVMKR